MSNFNADAAVGMNRKHQTDILSEEDDHSDDDENLFDYDDEQLMPELNGNRQANIPSEDLDDHSEDEEYLFESDDQLVPEIDRRGFINSLGLYVSYDRFRRQTWEMRAMDSSVRAWRKIRGIFSYCLCSVSPKDDVDTRQQIRMPAPARQHVGMKGQSTAETLTDPIVWFYKSSFLLCISAFLLAYLLFITLFQLILWLAIVVAHYRGDDCCKGFDYNSESFYDNYEVTLELSWTTFSTVGYGTISVPEGQGCHAVRYLLAIEAFVGILNSSICGAVFFSKIVRLHSMAHVTFASAICLQYGEAVTDPLLDVLTSDQVNNDDSVISQYPVMEWRCVNDRAVDGGGALINAHIRGMVAAIEAVAEDEEEQSGDQYVNGEVLHDNGEQIESFLSTSTRGGIKKRTFHQLHLTPGVHPYFSGGVWYIRHELNHKSPILKSTIRKRCLELGGWPNDMNSPEKIRSAMWESIEEVVITFQGKSNLTAQNVFLTQCYRLSDVYVGYKFAGMVYLVDKPNPKEENHGFKVDLSLIHDIVATPEEQSEPLGGRDDGVR